MRGLLCTFDKILPESTVLRFAAWLLFVENLAQGRKILAAQESYCGSTGRVNRDGRREERRVWLPYS